MRRILLSAVLFTLTALFCCTYAYGDAAVYRGSQSIGAVTAIENNSGLFLPVEDVGRLFGFNASRAGDELLLTRGNANIRVINNSTAAWRGMMIIPLHSTIFEQNGKLWTDSNSIAAIFQAFAGSGANNRISVRQTPGYSAASANVNRDVEYGSFVTVTEKPKPVTASTAPVILPTPKKSEPKSTPPVIVTASAKTEPEPVIEAKTVTGQKPVTVKPNRAKAATPVKPQPKYESFKLTDSKTEKGETYSGVIQGVRWTSTNGANQKIRAVFTVDKNADPQVFMHDKKLHALFSSNLENPENLKSPFENVTLETNRNDKGFEIIFTPGRIEKADKVILSSPRRIVFDFFFPDDVNIVKASVPVTPAPVTQTAKATPVVTESKPKPAVTSRPVSPAADAIAQTQQQNILVIPMKKGAKKTIVIDPGHGGKDPGASDNGVTEKNVNLGIGLELERVLLARGYNVIMTRKTDVYLKLQERADIANNANADLFVSIHVNALPSKKSMSGFEIYIMALPTDKDAMDLAKIENREYVEGKGIDAENVDKRTEMLLRILGDMQQNNKISESTEFAAALYNAGVRNNLPMRRVAQAPFFVLRGAVMPAVLLETGFVTNKTEAQTLTTQVYQQKIANAMAEGIINYLR